MGILNNLVLCWEHGREIYCYPEVILSTMRIRNSHALVCVYVREIERGRKEREKKGK